MDRLPADLMALIPDLALIDGLDRDTAMRFLRYFYAVPNRPQKPLRLKHRVLALYDPFALRSRFPAGRRLCCNLFTGCSHACRYCYISGYIQNPKTARPKLDFRKQLQRDLRDLTTLTLPMPLHISNSTDPLQEGMEDRSGDALHLLQRVVEYQHLFSGVTMLTKNPARLLSAAYLDPISKLGNKFCLQVSLTFWRDEPRDWYEPGAPSVEIRKSAIEKLRREGLRVALRTDPLFPTNPLPAAFFDKATVEEYGAVAAHSQEDLRQLVQFAANTHCERVIASPLKIPCGRWRDLIFLQQWQPLYRAAKGGYTRNFALRLPDEYAGQLMNSIAEFGKTNCVLVQHCKHNLIHNPA